MTINLAYYQDKANQISAVLQIFTLAQPALVSFFQFAEQLLPPGSGGQKMDYVKASIKGLLTDIPELQGKFDAAWATLQGLIEAALTISKLAGLVKAPVPAPAA